MSNDLIMTIWFLMFSSLSAAQASGQASHRMQVQVQWNFPDGHFSRNATSQGVPGVCVKGAKRALGHVIDDIPNAAPLKQSSVVTATAAVCAYFASVQVGGGTTTCGHIGSFYISDSAPGSRIDVVNHLGSNLVEVDCPVNGVRCSRHKPVV